MPCGANRLVKKSEPFTIAGDEVQFRIYCMVGYLYNPEKYYAGLLIDNFIKERRRRS